MGIYYGETEKEALDAMARDAGYRDQEEATEVAGPFEGTVTPVEKTTTNERGNEMKEQNTWQQSDPNRWVKMVDGENWITLIFEGQEDYVAFDMRENKSSFNTRKIKSRTLRGAKIIATKTADVTRLL